MMARFLCLSTLMLMLVMLPVSSPWKSCCTHYQQTPISVRVLRYYTVQEVTEYCNIEAIIFKTVRNRLVCASRDSEWVQQAMETVPEFPTN